MSIVYQNCNQHQQQHNLEEAKSRRHFGCQWHIIIALGHPNSFFALIIFWRCSCSYKDHSLSEQRILSPKWECRSAVLMSCEESFLKKEFLSFNVLYWAKFWGDQKWFLASISLLESLGPSIPQTILGSLPRRVYQLRSRYGLVVKFLL